jgi:hypothetical protein
MEVQSATETLCVNEKQDDFNFYLMMEVQSANEMLCVNEKQDDLNFYLMMEVQSATEMLCVNEKQDNESYTVYARLHMYTPYICYIIRACVCVCVFKNVYEVSCWDRSCTQLPESGAGCCLLPQNVDTRWRPFSLNTSEDNLTRPWLG